MRAMLPTLTGSTADQQKHEYLYWEFTKGPQQVIDKTALRQGDWKAVCKYRKGERQPMELYNLKEDLAEATDVSAQHPEVAKRLERLMQDAHQPLAQEESGK